MIDKKFYDVFGTMNFSPKASAALGNSRVMFVRVDKNEKKMRVGLIFNEIIDESCFTEFENKIRSRYPYVGSVDVVPEYILRSQSSDAGGDAGVISMFWKNVVTYVGRFSPLCRQVLNEPGTDWRLENGSLVLSVRDGAFYLKDTGCDKKISELLRDRLGLDVSVTVVNREPVLKNDPASRAETMNTRRESGLLRIEREDNYFKEKNNENENSNNENSNSISPVKTVKSKSEKRPRKRDFWDSGVNGDKNSGRSALKIKGEIAGPVWNLSAPIEPPCEVIVRGTIFRFEKREVNNGSLLVAFDLTDGNGAVTIKFFMRTNKSGPVLETVYEGACVKVRGMYKHDEYGKEFNISALEICPCEPEVKRNDKSEVKRVELHLHTHMSAMDGIPSAEEYIKLAAAWGHDALAITDHGVLQAYPEAMTAAKKYGVKVIYGLEAYITDDLTPMELLGNARKTVSAANREFVAFDIETTGLVSTEHKITEIGAVRIVNNEAVEVFNELVDPQTPIPHDIVKLTGITDEMVKGKPTIDEVLPRFMEFVSDSGLVAHNAKFDMAFLRRNAEKIGITIKNSVYDTLPLAQMTFPNLKRHKLDHVAEHIGFKLKNHHRASEDARACAEIFMRCREISDGGAELSHKQLKYSHATILVKNLTGLRNLYELVSKSHIEYFVKRPRIPKSEFIKLKEGLLIGSACNSGELYRAILKNETDERLEEIVSFYDYLEIQPASNNLHLLKSENINTGGLIEINKKIFALGKKYGKPAIAASDAHFLNPGDEIYKKIIMHVEKYQDADSQAPLYFRTTDEMLAEFSYLGDGAYEAVVTNTRLIADMIENIDPLPSGTFIPVINGADEKLKNSAYSRARAVYGEKLPDPVSERLERELRAIIGNGFSALYVAAQELIERSVAEGYVVGSRGSIGASFAATMAKITEVNPLSPHYVCPACKYSDFDSEIVKNYFDSSCADMPDAVCPKCGAALNKEGHNIPFETFMGFDGDKAPDIDLNFAGDYQTRAHAHTEEIFGAGKVYRAGTIGTMAEKTAFGYVKKYADDHGYAPRNAEINRMKRGLIGVKRTSGQHPGGIVLIPADKSIYDFTPLQHPANDAASGVITTHFDFNALDGRLLKLDNLGHDVPTIIHHLNEMTGVDPLRIDLGDKRVLSLFTSPDELGVTADDIGCKTGSLGLPEFGTAFVRQMLIDTQPKTFTELVRISGLSHGINVWLNNAQDLIAENKASLTEIIASREDMMHYFDRFGMDKRAAFDIIEKVRKGKGFTDDEEDLMLEAGVPDWYIESCRKITYLFPKSHATAYVMMAVRIGWFKIHHPLAFYAANFSVKSEDFDYEKMCFGKERVYSEIARVNALGKEASAKDKITLSLCEIVLEMYARGFKFVPLDLYEADVSKFIIKDGKIMAPLSSVQGLGGGAAESVAEARKNGEFATVADFKERTKVNKTVAELLKKLGILSASLPETNQMSFI